MAEKEENGERGKTWRKHEGRKEDTCTFLKRTESGLRDKKDGIDGYCALCVMALIDFM